MYNDSNKTVWGQKFAFIIPNSSPPWHETTFFAAKKRTADKQMSFVQGNVLSIG